MDPFARKMWRFGLGFGGLMLLLFAILTAFYVHQWPKCPDRIAGESDSTRHEWTAAILERRCGSEAPFVSRVNLRAAGALRRGFFSGQVSSGTVFAVEQDATGAGISLIWSGDSTLIIRCPRCNSAFILQRDQQWNGVKIQYRLP